jgi:hypothetical protein
MPNLVMVMPYQAYIRKAQAEGFRIHAIWDPAEAERLFGAEAAQYLRDVEAFADGFRLVDFTDHAAYADAIRAAVRETDADHVWHVGSEESMMLAYEVADELGKAVNSPRSVALLNDKLAMRTLLRNKGISAVRFAIAEHWTDVAALLADFTLPVVVKPTTLSASRGTYLLTDPADLPAWGETLAAYRYDGPLLIEEYLRGPEFSVETLTVRGEHHLIGVTRKLLGPLPHFVERGHLFGAPATVETSRRAADRGVAGPARRGQDPRHHPDRTGFRHQAGDVWHSRRTGAPAGRSGIHRAHRLLELSERGSPVGLGRRRGTRAGFRPHPELPVLGRGRAAGDGELQDPARLRDPHRLRGCRAGPGSRGPGARTDQRRSGGRCADRRGSGPMRK